jgi:tetratricopeptide (TPR) repeat protein
MQAKMLEKQGEMQTPIQIDLIEQAIALFRKVYGPQHTAIAHCLSSISAGYFGRGNYTRAKSYAQQAWDMYVNMDLEEHDDVVVILIQLVSCSFLLNEHEEAKSYLEQAQEIAKKNPSPYVSKQTLEILNQALKAPPSVARQMMEMLNQVLKAFPQEEDS